MVPVSLILALICVLDDVEVSIPGILLKCDGCSTLLVGEVGSSFPSFAFLFYFIIT